MNSILLVAHTPLGNALRQCAMHVFPDSAPNVMAVDVMPQATPEETLATARIALEQMGRAAQGGGVLVLTDIFGATPCNLAQRIVDGTHSRLVTGVNLPMLLRAVSYRHEPLDALVARAVSGGTQGVMQVGVAAPQNQPKRATSDQDHRDHQQ